MGRRRARFSRKRTVGRRRRFRTRRAARGKGYTAKKVYRALKPELKYSNFFQPTDPPFVSGTSYPWAALTDNLQNVTLGYDSGALLYVPYRLYHLTPLSVGANRDQRIGWRVKAKYINIKAKFSLLGFNGASTFSPCKVRIVILRDRQSPFGAAAGGGGAAPFPNYAATGPSLLSFLRRYLNTGVVDDAITSPFIDEWQSMWTKLHDRVYSFDVTKGATFSFRKNIRMHGAEIQYPAAGAPGAGVNSASKGAVYMFFMLGSDTVVNTADPTCVFDLESTYRFTDA